MKEDVENDNFTDSLGKQRLMFKISIQNKLDGNLYILESNVYLSVFCIKGNTHFSLLFYFILKSSSVMRMETLLWKVSGTQKSVSHNNNTGLEVIVLVFIKYSLHRHAWPMVASTRPHSKVTLTIVDCVK